MSITMYQIINLTFPQTYWDTAFTQKTRDFLHRFWCHNKLVSCLSVNFAVSQGKGAEIHISPERCQYQLQNSLMAN